MKTYSFVFLLLVVIFSVGCLADCPAGEYNPGPDCAFEPICATRSSHTYRRHYCDCWCTPPKIRNSETNECLDRCP